MNNVPPYSKNASINNKGFISSILQRLPYVNSVIDVNTSNSRYELFDKLSKRSEQKLLRQSIITGPELSQRENYASTAFGGDAGYHRFIYAQLDTDKIRRLSEYRRIAAFSEVSDCLDEICGDFINKDEKGKVISINFDQYNEIPQEAKTEIQKEFYKFVKNYDL